MSTKNSAAETVSDVTDATATATAAAAAAKMQSKLDDANDKLLRGQGYRKARPFYEMGVGSGFGRMAEGKFSSVVEGVLQVLSPVAIATSVGLATGLIPVPGSRAGATCGD
jgi:hypothetical protein